MILGSNPKAQYLAHKIEIDQAVKKVLDSGWYILGDEVKQFETEFAQYNACTHAIGVGSGTEALHLALVACGIQAGDEVITVSHTAVATIAAIELCGAIAVFADIVPDTYTIAINEIPPLITKKTKAILPVHIYGHPANMPEICAIAKQHDLFVIEDCAQAHGAEINGQKVGTFGDFGCFSFYPTKNLGALGDGGAVITDNSELSEKINLLREYGWKERFISSIPGWNSRLDEIQAAILRVKLKHLDEDNKKRQKIAKIYQDNIALTNIILPQAMVNFKHVFHLFVIRTKYREKLFNYLKNSEIGVAIHYPVPVHQQQAYKKYSRKLPITQQISKEIISLPIYPELNSQTERIIEQIHKYEQSTGGDYSNG